MQERPHTFTLKLSKLELAQLHRLAASQDREISRVVRAWLAAAYVDRFGAEPPPEPKLKHKKAA